MTEREAIEMALKIARQTESSQPKNGMVFSGQIVEELRYCAVHDQPFYVVYQRQPTGKLRFMQTVRSAPSNGLKGTPQKATEIKRSEVDMHGEKLICPWCGASEIQLDGRRPTACLCSDCDGYVCFGRTKGSWFVCRDSCGGSGEMGKDWVDGRGTQRNPSQPQPSAAPSRYAPSGDNKTVSASPLLLSDGRR